MPREDDGMGRPLPVAPLACIPTTAGTGSEVSMAAVIKVPEEELKMEVADYPLFPRLAILDPEATRTLPPQVAAATAMDATTHAIEGYTCTTKEPLQDARSQQALRLIAANVERAVRDGPNDDEARGNMLVAASLAINVNLGSTHAMSHPAGAQFGVPHGVANAIHLPHVIRFNAEDAPTAALYGELADLVGAEDLAAWVEQLTAGLGLPARLSQVGVPEQGLPALVEGALGDGTSLLNPREVSEEDYAALYRAAL
jgi:alcohol dehydrogenase class IV